MGTENGKSEKRFPDPLGRRVEPSREASSLSLGCDVGRGGFYVSNEFLAAQFLEIGGNALVMGRIGGILSPRGSAVNPYF